MEKTFLEKTLRMVSSSDIPVAKMCAEVGVSVRWYYKLTSGNIKDPSVNKIQRLHDYLAERQKWDAA
jgi:hypothetical protein